MNTLRRTVGVAAMVAALFGWTGSAPAAPQEPLTEAQLLTLVQIKLPDEVITKRLADTGVDFPAGDATLARLKAAGASEAVLAALKKVAKPAADEVLSVWVAKNYGWENPLHSELSVNGKSLGTFSSETEKPVADHLKPGWNTITLKTAPQPNATKSNELIFRFGPLARKDGKRVMTTVLWEFRNGTDWKHHDDGTHTHQGGPAVKDVTLNYRVYYAGLELEGRKLAERDYVLIGSPEYDSWNSPVNGTVFVNDQPVSTFLGRRRQVVITPYLKKGENTIKLVSARVKDAIAGNDVKFQVGGPAEYNVTRGKFDLRPVAQFEAMEGWKQDPKTGQLVSQAKPDADTVEREVRFTLDHEPGKK